MALKAFNFTENEILNTGIHDESVYEREKELALEFVRTHLGSTAPRPEKCPLCESDNTEAYAVFEGVQYMRCTSCWSLYAPACKEVLNIYREYEPIKVFRATDEYQKSASIKRKSVWDEQLFWIKFRAERYLAPLNTLHCIEVSKRYDGFSTMAAAACASYDSFPYPEAAQGSADIVLFFGVITSQPDILETLHHIKTMVNRGGLLFLDSRVSTGFDILTLGNKINTVFPYEHAVLPSVEALEIVLKRAGFEVLEISTPGALDVKYVADNSFKLEQDDLFARYLVEKADDNTRSEFQRFLQKNAISSYAQIVARA